MIGLIKLNLLKLNLGKLAPGSEASKPQARASLLGLALDGHRLEAVLLRRVNGSLRLLHSFATSLQLNLLTDDPALVGREIRNHLDRAGIRERHCTVCLPLEWALTLHTPVPPLPPEDVDSFLDLEAERGFPVNPDSLGVVTSRCRSENGTELATLVGIPKEHLAALQKVLKSAQLQPVSFSLSMPSLQDPKQGRNEGIAALAIRDNHVELQVCCGGGVAALRALQGALEQDGVHKKPYVDVVARDLRITLGQLPADLRQTVRQLKVFGNGEELERFAEELSARARLLGLEVQLIKGYSLNAGMAVPPEPSASPALSLALRFLTGDRAPGFEFLPPKVGMWKQLTTRYSSGKLVWTGGLAMGVVVVVLAGFLLQQYQLGRWRTRWLAMKPQVTRLDELQQQVRRFRPWFDDSFRSLSILRRVTEAFPEDGAVVAKTVEIRDPGIVTCTGTARDQQALLKVVDQLRASGDFSSVQVDQIRGKQFSINLRWSGGGAQ